MLSDRECKSKYLKVENLVTLIAASYFANTADKIPDYYHMAVGASVEDYDHLSGRLHFVLGNMAFDEAQRGLVEERFKDAFTHYTGTFKKHATI